MFTTEGFTFTVPGAPVPKARARVSIREGKVRAHTPKKTASYEKRVAMFARTARPRNWPLECAYKVSFIAYVAEDRGDIDNLLKSILDGAQGILWENDKSVRVLGHCEVILGDVNPRIEVGVVPLSVRCSSCPCVTFTPTEGRCFVCFSLLEKRRARSK